MLQALNLVAAGRGSGGLWKTMEKAPKDHGKTRVFIAKNLVYIHSYYVFLLKQPISMGSQTPKTSKDRISSSKITGFEVANKIQQVTLLL